MKKIILISLIIFIISSNSLTSTNMISPVGNNIGVILGDVVNVRSIPGSNGNIVDTLKENEYVVILEWTNKRETIGKFTDKWVKVRTQKRLEKEGYLFGAFLFEMDVLYKYRWRLITGTEMTGNIWFYKNRTYKEVSFQGHYSESPSAPAPQLWTGIFYVFGRKVILNPKTQTEFIKNKNLYLFKLENKYQLVPDYFSISYSGTIFKFWGLDGERDAPNEYFH